MSAMGRNAERKRRVGLRGRGKKTQRRDKKKNRKKLCHTTLRSFDERTARRNPLFRRAAPSHPYFFGLTSLWSTGGPLRPPCGLVASFRG